jgi:drug/metabolite transporter (DMT)-like permease
MDSSGLWIPFTLLAAAAQTARNAMQRELTGILGTVGATHVRFLYGFPFALVAFALVLQATGATMPATRPMFWAWLAVGAGSQILATALMLSAMRERSFVVTVAYIKTEPLHVALFGLVFLGERLGGLAAAGVAVATAGVIVMSARPAQGVAGWSSAAIGLAAAAAFGLSAVGYRGAILSLDADSFVVASTFTLAVALPLQACVLSAYLLMVERGVLAQLLLAWRPSLLAGFMGALASAFWFLAFALASAASVRTLALVEVIFAQAISRFVFRQAVSKREVAGIVLVTIGVVLLLAG